MDLPDDQYNPDGRWASSHPPSSGKHSPRLDYKLWFNIMCTMAGTGILQLPYTLKQGGWVSIGLVIIIAAMTNTTGKWLIRCLYTREWKEGANDAIHGALLEPPRRLKNYPAIGAAAYGEKGRVLVQVFHKATLLGVTTIFLILSAKFLMEGIGGGGEGMLPSLGTSADISTWQTRWTLISACLVLIPVVTLRTLNEIAPLAAFGMLASMLCVLEVVVFSVLLYPVTAHTAELNNLPVPESFSAAGTGNTPVGHENFAATDFPSAFAAITLSFGGHAVFPSIESHARSPGSFVRAFNTAYVTLVVMYILTAGFGYYTFGQITYSPILCNFPRDVHTIMGAITATTKLMIAFHVMSAYPILMNVVVLEIERVCGVGFTGSITSSTKGSTTKSTASGDGGLLMDGIQGGGGSSGGYGATTDDFGPSFEKDDQDDNSDSWRPVLLRTAIRVCLVSVTCAIAIAIPYFAEVMSLVGALCLTMIVFVLPVVFAWKLCVMTFTEKVWGVCILFVGCAGGVIGSIQAVVQIAQKIEEGAAQ